MKALFLDRDGIINRDVGYLSSPDHVEWMPGIFELARTAKALDYQLVVVTNQSGIGRGLYSQEAFEELMRWMRTRFEREGAPLDAVYCCPFHPEHGVGEYRREHPDRKPKPGMLLRAAADRGLNLAHSLMAGDRCSDVLAANAAGLRQVFLMAGTETAICPGTFRPVSALHEVREWIEADSRSADRYL